ncbi:MAG TPA: hypothetical protein VF236_00710 [Gaiellaceae bacterium]
MFRALRQVLEQAERWQWIDQNPARYVKNPKPKRPEVQPFTSWAEVEAVADELDQRFAAPHLRDVESRRRRRPVHPFTEDGDVAGNDRRDLWAPSP